MISSLSSDTLGSFRLGSSMRSIFKKHRTRFFDPRLVWFLIPFLLAGCAPYGKAPKVYQHRRARLRVDVPASWLKYRPTKSALLLTRDGLRLENIEIQLHRVGKKLEGTDRVYNKQMLPLEIADLSLGLIEASDNTKNFDVTDLSLVQIASAQGFRAEGTFVDAAGLEKKMRMYGVLIGEYVIEFTFVAAMTVYFDKYSDEFERAVASARVF